MGIHGYISNIPFSSPLSAYYYGVALFFSWSRFYVHAVLFLNIVFYFVGIILITLGNYFMSKLFNLLMWNSPLCYYCGQSKHYTKDKYNILNSHLIKTIIIMVKYPLYIFSVSPWSCHSFNYGSGRPS